MLGTKDLTRVPRIQVCRPTDVHNILTSHQHNTMRAGLDSDGSRAWDYDLQVRTYYTWHHSA